MHDTGAVGPRTTATSAQASAEITLMGAMSLFVSARALLAGDYE
jgi:hypothetical protein